MYTRDEVIEVSNNLKNHINKLTDIAILTISEIKKLDKENTELKAEIQFLKDTACEILEEEKQAIEPCPVCGGEMCYSKFYRAVHLHYPNDECSWQVSDAEAHNVIARFLREASFACANYDVDKKFKFAYIAYRALQDKVKGEAK